MNCYFVGMMYGRFCAKVPYFVLIQTTQYPKEKVQKDKQRPTKDTHKTKDRVT
jgi:hypothetical protein